MVLAFASLLLAAKLGVDFAQDPLLAHFIPAPVRLTHGTVVVFFDPAAVVAAAQDVHNLRTHNLIEDQLFLVQGDELLQINGVPGGDLVRIKINHPFLLAAKESYFHSSPHATAAAEWVLHSRLEYTPYPVEQAKAARVGEYFKEQGFGLVFVTPNLLLKNFQPGVWVMTGAIDTHCVHGVGPRQV